MNICRLAFILGSLVLPMLALQSPSAANRAQAGEVSLTVTRVRGCEQTATELEGDQKGKEVQYALIACDLEVDNQTGEDLTVQSNFFSALDYLTLQLLRGDKVVAEERFTSHLSPSTSDGKPFVLKQGKTRDQLRFPVRLPPKDWAGLQIRLVGSLPGSNFKGALVSNKAEIRRVEDLNQEESGSSRDDRRGDKKPD